MQVSLKRVYAALNSVENGERDILRVIDNIGYADIENARANAMRRLVNACNAAHRLGCDVGLEREQSVGKLLSHLSCRDKYLQAAGLID